MTSMTTQITSSHLFQFSQFFKRCVYGYHLLNKDPIKEAVWETVNTQIFKHSGCTVYSQSSGSHSPGSDISADIGCFSNKSGKYVCTPMQKSIDISSYRLTSVCSAANPGTVDSIIDEINRRKNFQYYSVVARTEAASQICYDWIMAPSDHPVFNPASYAWEPMIGKRGKNKDAQIGWKTNVVDGSSMSITFSMSSQLWMSVCMTPELQTYIIATTDAKVAPIMDYIELGDKFPEV